MERLKSLRLLCLRLEVWKTLNSKYLLTSELLTDKKYKCVGVGLTVIVWLGWPGSAGRDGDVLDKGER